MLFTDRTNKTQRLNHGFAPAHCGSTWGDEGYSLKHAVMLENMIAAATLVELLSDAAKMNGNCTEHASCSAYAQPLSST